MEYVNKILLLLDKYKYYNIYKIKNKVGIILGILHAFLPMNDLTEKIFGKIEALPNEETYDEVKDTFRTNYA